MTYEEHRRTLIEYLKAKVELADWHGVSDAANDLRVLEAAPPIVSRQERDQAAFNRIAERIEAEERGGRHPSAYWPGISKPAPRYTERAPFDLKRERWWKRLLRWLRVTN